MDITISVSKTDHDLVLTQLRKNSDGTDDLTVAAWLEGALNGKINNCRKRADPIAVANNAQAKAETERDRANALAGSLQAQIDELTATE